MMEHHFGNGMPAKGDPPTGASVSPIRLHKVGSDWPAVGKDGALIHKSQENIEHFLSLVDCVPFFDEFAGKSMLEISGKAVALDDAELQRLYFEADRMRLRPPKNWFDGCVANMAYTNRRNAVRDAINALVWDGEPRLDGWLVRYAGGQDTAFSRAAFMCSMVAMPRRIRHPGVKHDQITVFEGLQGCGKSSFLRILARSDDLFTDALPIGADDKTTLEIAHGKLIVELGELNGLRKREQAAIKAFASRQSDRARLAYGHYAVEIPRQFTIWGSTNDAEYLDDATGNRRFWPLKVGQIDLAQARADVDQLWAEAAALEARGFPITLPTELWTEATAEQSNRLVSDTWQDAIADKLEIYRTQSIKTRTGDVLRAIGVPLERQDRGAQMRAAKAMQKLGFEPRPIGRRRLAGWCRGNADEAILLTCANHGGDFRPQGETS